MHESQYPRNKCVFYIIPFLILDGSNCTVKIDGKTVNKAVGEIWNSSKDLCLKHTCEIEPNGTAIESTFREYCSHQCNNVSIRCWSVCKYPDRIRFNLFTYLISLRIMNWCRKKVNAAVNVCESDAPSTIKRTTLAICGKVKTNANFMNVPAINSLMISLRPKLFRIRNHVRSLMIARPIKFIWKIVAHIVKWINSQQIKRIYPILYMIWRKIMQ